MKFLLLFTLIVLSALGVEVSDTGDKTQEEVVFPGGENKMNGFKLDDFKNFAEEWKMVTVRFREDSKEMRLTYANKTAWDYLISKKGGAYPDGAVFAKIGIKTDVDPLFPSSVVPSGAKRFQFMVHDENKFKNTGGWGYVLFNSEGKTFPGDVAKNSEACHACHRAAESRSFVFSQAASFNSIPESKAVNNQENAAIQFKSTHLRELPFNLKRYLSVKAEPIEQYTGPMVENFFQGTFDEIIPALVERSIKVSRPALFLSKDHRQFSLVQSFLNKKKCPQSERPLYVQVHQTMTVPEKKNSSKLQYKIIKKEMCRNSL